MVVASIVLPTLIRNREQLNTTLKCIDLAKSKTNLDFELIIVETETDYLSEYADLYIQIPFKSISTLDINRGFRASGCGFTGLLTNDVYVSDGWLEALIETFDKKKDCGISTLASTQFNEKLQPGKIEEWVWCSVFLTRTEYLRRHNYFDAENFPSVWDDSDFVTKLCLDGLKPYKNFGCLVHHKVGMTEYKNPQHEALYILNGHKYNEKYKNCKHPIYEHLRLK